MRQLSSEKVETLKGELLRLVLLCHHKSSLTHKEGPYALRISIKVIFLLFYISAAHFVIVQTVLQFWANMRNLSNNQMWYLRLGIYCWNTATFIFTVGHNCFLNMMWNVNNFEGVCLVFSLSLHSSIQIFECNFEEAFKVIYQLFFFLTQLFNLGGSQSVWEWDRGEMTQFCFT